MFTEEKRLLLYGNSTEAMGWCNADLQKVQWGLEKTAVDCPCAVDGTAGLFCQEKVQAYCLGACSNNGDCHSGFCNVLFFIISMYFMYLFVLFLSFQCKDGWYGIDCSIPSSSVVPTLPAGKFSNFSQLEVPLWLKVPHVLNNETVQKVRKVQRRRPLIYIYDLPGNLTFHHYEVYFLFGLIITKSAEIFSQLELLS